MENVQEGEVIHTITEEEIKENNLEGQVEPGEEVVLPAEENQLSPEDEAILQEARKDKIRKECAAEIDKILTKYGMTLVPTGIAVVENNQVK